MQDFNNKVAVITGGASGIGLALAHGAVQRGAKVVIADIRDEPLAQALADLTAAGGDVLAVKTDVSKAEEVEALAQAAVDRFGKVNLMFNNAGVFASGLTWETSAEEYDWVIGVNLKSVINTSSGAGITVNPGFSSYSMTKHAVVALSEALYLDLGAEQIGTIGVTIVMPGVVQSKIMFPEKTGPDALQTELQQRLKNPTLNALEQFMRQAVDEGLPAKDLSDMVFEAIAKRDLYVLPNFTNEASQAQAQAIAMGRCTATNPYPALLGGLLETLNGD
ncbi:MAG: hypothetical protein RLZZ141_2275 [Pseudomonadota bacterium]